MGKGYHNYMAKKCFHPGSKHNIKRVWMAQQKTKYYKQKQEELTTKYQREEEMLSYRALLADEKTKLGLSFMYDAPPGAKKEKEKEDNNLNKPEYKFEWKRNAPREQKLDKLTQKESYKSEKKKSKKDRKRYLEDLNSDSDNSKKIKLA